MRIAVIIFFFFFIVPFSSSSMKIKMRGSGGIINNGEKNVICPIKENGVCAEIEGSLWDLIKQVFSKSLSSTQTTNQDFSVSDVRIKVYDNGKEKSINGTFQILKGATITSLDSGDYLINGTIVLK